MKLIKSVRQINKIILHCTATPEGRDIDAETITKWHKNRGWLTNGYHYIVKLDGTIEEGRSVHMVGAHTNGQNTGSLGVVYVGGCDDNMKPKDTRTQEQDTALTNLLTALLEKYPNATIHGHNEFAPKACPSFNVQEEYSFLINPKVEEENE